MRGDLVQVEKYGVSVWANLLTESLRPEECLCLNCALMPDEKCPAAAALYATCLEHDLALAVTRCPSFEPLAEK